MNKKAVIIGAGISGMSTASYLQMSGFDTEIFEMHDLPGGLCTSWNRKDFIIDGCIHWLVGSRQGSTFNKLWSELIDINKMQFVYFDTYGTFTDKNGNSVNFYTDVDKLEKELLSVSAEDKIPILKFCKLVRKFKNFDPPADSTPELMTSMEKIRFLLKILRYLPDLNKYLKLSLQDFAKEFKNPLLQFTFENLFTPETALIFVIINLVWFNSGDAAYPVGGSLNFARTIEQKYISLGGKIHYNSKVISIVTEQSGKNSTVKAVNLKNGEKINADIIISATDAYFTLKNMLEDKFTTKKWQDRFYNLKTFSSYIQVSIGINRIIDGKIHSRFIKTRKKYQLSENDIISAFNFRIHNFDPTLSPAGKTLITTLIEVHDYKYWTDLRQSDRHRYKTEKKQLAEFIIEEIESHVGTFSSDIEMLDVSTPATVIRYTGNWKGSYEGWLLNSKTGFSSFERSLPGLNNFYMTGQWIEPGGGIPSAFMSGRNLAGIICKKFNNKLK